MREWEAKLAPVLSETLRKQRRGRRDAAGTVTKRS
jgi:hypothetical protein